jgi:hypothetical protein
VNSLKATVIPQMMSAKRRAARLAELGRISDSTRDLFMTRADNMIEFLEDTEETEVLYGQAGSDQADQ